MRNSKNILNNNETFNVYCSFFCTRGNFNVLTTTSARVKNFHRRLTEAQNSNFLIYSMMTLMIENLPIINETP